jgi:hypothetical protein
MASKDRSGSVQKKHAALVSESELKRQTLTAATPALRESGASGTVSTLAQVSRQSLAQSARTPPEILQRWSNP